MCLRTRKRFAPTEAGGHPQRFKNLIWSLGQRENTWEYMLLEKQGA